MRCVWLGEGSPEVRQLRQIFSAAKQFSMFIAWVGDGTSTSIRDHQNAAARRNRNHNGFRVYPRSLHHVVRIGLISGDAEGNPEETFAMAHHQCPIGILISREHCLGHSVVVLAHANH